MAYLLEPPTLRLMMPTLKPDGWRSYAAPRCPTLLYEDGCRLKSVVAIFIGAGLGALLLWRLDLTLNSYFPGIPPGTLAANLDHVLNPPHPRLWTVAVGTISRRLRCSRVASGGLFREFAVSRAA